MYWTALAAPQEGADSYIHMEQTIGPGSMRIIAFIKDLQIVKKILQNLGLWHVRRKPHRRAKVIHPPLEEPAN
jgi:hypothetical protein